MIADGSDCPTGKVQYSDEGAADAVRAARLRGRRVKRYRCLLCGCLHVGHQRRADTKAEKARRR